MPAESVPPAHPATPAENPLDAERLEYERKLGELSEAVARRISLLPESKRRFSPGSRQIAQGNRGDEGKLGAQDGKGAEGAPAPAAPGASGKPQEKGLAQQPGMASGLEGRRPSLLRRALRLVRRIFGMGE